MAINNEDNDGAFGGILKTLLALTPAAAGAGYAIQQASRNSAISVSGQTTLGDVGSKVGKKLRDRSVELANQAMDAEKVKEFVWAVNEHRAVIQALSATLADPSNALDPNAVLAYREKLVDLADHMTNTIGPEGKELVNNIITTLVGNDKDNRFATSLSNNIRQYAQVGAVLTQPTPMPSSGEAFNTIDIGKKKRMRAKYGENTWDTIQRRKKLYEKTYDRPMNLVHPKGREQEVWARFNLGPADNPSWKNVPLHVPEDSTGRRVWHLGENFNTPYTSGPYLLDAEKVVDILDKNPDATASAFRPAAVSVEDHIQKVLIEGEKNKRSFSKSMAVIREVFTTDSHTRLAGIKNHEMQNHLIAQSQFSDRVIHLVNVDPVKSRRDFLLTRLATVESDAETRGFSREVGSDRQNKNVVFQRGSTPIGVLDIGMPATFSHAPLVARWQQTLGRPTEALTDVPDFGVGGVIKGRAGAENVLTHQHVTGGTNRAILLDMRAGEDGGRLGKTAGRGQSIGIGKERVRVAFTKPLLDPLTHFNQSNVIIDSIKSAGMGEFVDITEQLRRGGGYVGEGPAGPQFTGRDPNTTKTVATLSEPRMSDGKMMVHLDGFHERSIRGTKFWGTLIKGMKSVVSRQQMRSVLGSYEGVLGKDGLLKQAQIPLKSVIASAGDMIHKAPGNLMRQALSGYMMVTGDTDIQGMLKQHRKKSRWVKAGRTLGEIDAAETVEAVFRALKARKVNPNAIGAVMAGAFGVAEKGRYLDLEAMTRDMAGDKEVWDYTRRGLALATETLTVDQGQGTYGRGRGAINSRVLQGIQQQIYGLGMSTDQVSDALVDIYSKRVGREDPLVAASALKRMMKSVSGQGDLFESTVPKLSVDDVLEAALVYNDKDPGKNFGTFMSQFDEGFDLVFDNSSGTLETAAKKVFGPAGTIHIPGKNALAAMSGTAIKTAKGSQYIGSRYERMVSNFVADLGQLHGQTDVGVVSKKLQGFKKDVVEMAAESVMAVTEGKIKGSALHIGEGYDLVGMTNLDPQQAKRANKLLRKTRDTARWVDSAGFLGQLKDFMGSTSDTQDKLRRFFLSGELPTGKAQGVLAIGTRYPALGKGNTGINQIFRALHETGKGSKDKSFRMFAGSDIGREFLQANPGIGSFTDLAKKENKDLVDPFFRAMAQWVPNYEFAGGGQSFTAMQEQTFMVNGKKVTAAIDQLTGAVGDVDGDYYQFQMFKAEQEKAIMERFQSGAGAEWQQRDLNYKIKTELLAEEAKIGLDKASREMGIIDGNQAVWEDVLKEKGVKELTGRLDIQSNALRRALVDNSLANADEADTGLTLLKVMQEHTTIKGKKLPRFMPWAEELTQAIGTLMTQGDIGQLETLMKDKMFVGSHYAGSGLNVEAGGSKFAMSLDSTLQFMHESARLAINNNTNNAPSAGQIKAMMGRGGRVAELTVRHVVNSADQLEGSMLQSFEGRAMASAVSNVETAMGKLSNVFSNIDTRATAPVALGVAASLLAMTALGNEGYSAQPMYMPGDRRQPQVEQAIASGSLFAPRAVSSPVDNQPSMSAPPMSSPINTGQTYMGKPNSYQIRGELHSTSGLDRLGSYMSPLLGRGGSTNVRITDARRPISPTYIDQMIGEY